MRRLLAAAAGLAISAALSAGHAQTVYPIDRADILTGARFDFKVEFPGLVDPAKLSVTLNGEDHAKLFGKAATFVEREDGKDQSALILRDVSLSQPGNYKVRVTDGTQTRELDWKQRGYMVALPLRRGYGETGGPWRENYGSCGNPDYYRAGLVTA